MRIGARVRQSLVTAMSAAAAGSLIGVGPGAGRRAGEQSGPGVRQVGEALATAPGRRAQGPGAREHGDPERLEGPRRREGRRRRESGAGERPPRAGTGPGADPAGPDFLWWGFGHGPVPPLVTRGTVAGGWRAGRAGTHVAARGSRRRPEPLQGAAPLRRRLARPCGRTGGSREPFPGWAGVRGVYRRRVGVPGSPVIARPFFDVGVDPNQEAALIAAAPGEAKGRIGVTTSAQFQQAGVDLVYNTHARTHRWSIPRSR